MAARRAICITVTCVLTTWVVSHCAADSWGPPKQEHWSANRRFVLKVAWPGNKIALFHADAQSEPQEQLWSRPYVDDTWPPHAAYVANDGSYVVLRDLHHNLGRGKVLVFLGRKGEIIRSYELSDLLNREQIRKSRHTISSVWWSEPGWFSFLREYTLFAFVTSNGIIQCFTVADGNRVDLDEKTLDEIRALATQAASNMLADQNGRRREAGAKLAGALKAEELAPDLKTLLRDRTVTSWHGSSKKMNEHYGVQVEAARALATLVHTNVVSLIEPLLSNSTHVVRNDLLDVVAGLDGGLHDLRTTPDSEYLLSVWHRLAKHPDEGVRRYASRAVVAKEQIDYILDRPVLLDDPDEMIRRHAVRSLMKSGDKRAIPMLRKFLNDSEPWIRKAAQEAIAWMEKEPPATTNPGN